MRFVGACAVPLDAASTGRALGFDPFCSATLFDIDLVSMRWRKPSLGPHLHAIAVDGHVSFRARVTGSWRLSKRVTLVPPRTGSAGSLYPFTPSGPPMRHDLPGDHD
jgi:hypothetical protein